MTVQVGETELDTYVRVDKADGSTQFFHVVNGVNVSISEAQYDEATKDEG